VQLTDLLRIKVFTVVKMLMLAFWIVMPCGIAEDTSVSEEHTASICKAEVGICLQVHMVLLFRRPTWTCGLVFPINVYILLFKS
jgi:hypothetical protein